MLPAETSLKIGSTLQIRFPDGSGENLQIDRAHAEIISIVEQALQAQDEAWKEKVRGLKMDVFHYAADMDWENGWADAVTKFNLKIDTLLKEI
jgi:hypothetical protein